MRRAGAVLVVHFTITRPPDLTDAEHGCEAMFLTRLPSGQEAIVIIPVFAHVALPVQVTEACRANRWRERSIS